MKKKKLFWMITLSFVITVASAQQIIFPSKGKVNFPLTSEDEAMLDSIQKRTFQYFLHERHPEHGIVKDRAASWAPASIAATGFGIPSFAIGAERQWITREQAATITLRILTFFMNSVQGADTNTTGYKGFYYHFLRLKSGTREWKCELSSIDTGILMMGILFARNYYDQENETEKKIRDLAARLLGRIDWEFMEMPDTGRFANTISMGWTPEKKLHDFGWSGYNEALMLYILAAGTGMKNAETSYQSWLQSYQWYTPYKGWSHVAFPPLFGHQFSQAFIDFRGIADPYMKEKGIDYFENSRRATYVQRLYAIENPHGWTGYDSLCWGVTASDGPGEQYDKNGKKFLGYAGRGTSGPEYNYFDDGTLAPYASLSSLPFAPEIVLPTIRSMNDRFGKIIWGKYGYYDAFNPTAQWVDNDFIGIDQGPLLMMIENFRTGLIWNYMMKDPIIQKGLGRLGFSAVPQEKTQRILDDFENSKGWNIIRSDGVDIAISSAPGISGNALSVDYNFTKGTGYGGVQKWFPVDLPENYELSFYIKGESPSNNFEIKFLDSTGNNVWWVINRSYKFPDGWTKIRIKKRHISFAWGPTADQQLKRIDRIEFTVSSVVGGKGTILIDDLRFEKLPPELHSWPAPVVTATSFVKNHAPQVVADGSDNTWWESEGDEPGELVLDFGQRRELGGLQINWMKNKEASSYEILLTENGIDWTKVYNAADNQSETSFIRLPEAEAEQLKIKLISSKNKKGFGIREVKVLDIKQSMTMNDFLIYVAKNSPQGDYPRYFSEQATYWTVMGVNNDVKEALINEDGMVEVDKGRFSIEPMLGIDGSLLNWNKFVSTPSMGEENRMNNFDFMPSVTWQVNGIDFTTSVIASGQANKDSHLDLGYTLKNNQNKAAEVQLYLLIRPYQVNPYYQFLNMSGGAGKIQAIRAEKEGWIMVDDKAVIPQTPFTRFGAAAFEEGALPGLIRNGNFPQKQAVTDPMGQANGVIQYPLHMEPGETWSTRVVVPFYGVPHEKIIRNIDQEISQTRDFWKTKTGHVTFNLPPSADQIINTYRANLAYILVNRDVAGIQPGSRSYERSWIRDGSLTSSALLKSGIVEEVKDFIKWYAAHQYENGKVPCVVDFRGPDPVPENDSHGQLIYLIREYFNFTKDTAFLRSMNSHVIKAVEYIGLLVAERSTDHFRQGNDSIRAYFGLVPESISHEGYSAKPMHSYWDDFFTIKGLKDAADIQLILGEKENYELVRKMRDEFTLNLYNSMRLAMKLRKVDYIPGCVELGDFDPTSTTVALTPCNELKNLPKPQVYNTFDKYFQFFRDRREGKIVWDKYTPYENRLIGSYILLDQPERAHELISFFLSDQRPQGWYHWAEVVWSDDRRPGYIGDMPHTWVGSDFINAFRSAFVYENEYDQSLVLAAALYQDWIDSPEGMSVENLPTYYGELTYSIRKNGNSYRFNISGDVKLPSNGIKIKNFNQSRMPVKVTVNGKPLEHYSANEIPVAVCPADLIITY